MLMYINVQYGVEYQKSCSWLVIGFGTSSRLRIAQKNKNKKTRERQRFKCQIRYTLYIVAIETGNSNR